MKVLMKRSPQAGLDLADIAVPDLDYDGVLIQVLRTGICGTDRRIRDWTPWARGAVTPPRVLGHEFVGVIADVGRGVGNLQPGQLVSAEGHFTCGRCSRCHSGRRHHCPHAQLLGIDRDGAFAEFVACPARNVWLHQPGISLDAAAIWDVFGNAVHLADTFPLRGRSVLITGAGPVGILSASVAAYRGASLVTVSDPDRVRLERARSGGADHAIDPTQQPILEFAHSIGLDEGYDIGLEASGSASALSSLVDVVAPGGSVAIMGLPDNGIRTNWSQIALRMLTIKGVAGRQIFDTWHSMTELYNAGLDPSFIVTHRFDYFDYDKAFRLAGESAAIKVILTWSHGGEDRELQ